MARVQKIIMMTALGLFLLLLTGGVFICRRINRIGEVENELRCADLARGKSLVRSLDSIITHRETCHISELEQRVKAASTGQRAEWDLHIDTTDCSYTLHTYSASAWPIWIAVHLGYNSRTTQWEFICDGDRLRLRCP